MINQIIFSGIDGCGKSTQISRLSKHFELLGVNHQIIWARPGSTPMLIKLKSIARFLFRSLPASGRSKKRDDLLKNSKIGQLWLWLSMLELLYIYKLKSYILNSFGRVVIYDRHFLDSMIDLELLMGINLRKYKFFDFIFVNHPSALKIYLEIPTDVSQIRCENKWEPFPDNSNEKEIRHTLYKEYMHSNNSYHKIDGLRSPDSIHSELLKLIK